VQIVNNFAVQSYSRKLHIPHIKTSHRTSHFTTRISGHVGIQPENVGLVAADDRTRAKHRFKFRAIGSSTQAFRHSFAVRTVGDWNSLPSRLFQGGAVQGDADRIRTVKRHPPFTRYSTRRTVNYLSEETEAFYQLPYLKSCGHLTCTTCT